MLCYTGATTKHLIASFFAQDKELQSEVKRFFNYKEFYSDVIQDILLYILELQDESKLVNICQRNQFNYWLFRVLSNQRADKSSRLNKYYINKSLELNEFVAPTTENEFINKEQQEFREFIIELIKDELKKINKTKWYQCLVFKEYADMKEEYRQNGKKLKFIEFSRSMKINNNSLWDVIKKVKTRIKERINEHL